jgi:hypothetical protein
MPAAAVIPHSFAFCTMPETYTRKRKATFQPREPKVTYAGKSKVTFRIQKCKITP